MTPSDQPPSDPSRSDPSRSARDPRTQDRLLDAVRGELSPRERRAHEDRLAADPALRAEQERLDAFLAAIHEVQEVAVDPDAALRIATRVREQVGAEEARARRDLQRPAPSRRRLAWGRVLAVSVALHVLVLGFLAFHIIEDASEDRSRFVNAQLQLPASALDDEDALWDPIPSPWEGAALGARVPGSREPDMERLQQMWDTDGVEERLAPLDELEDHPRHLALEMVVRRHAALKRARLGELGLDGAGTLRRVDRGLKALATRQRADGSYAAGGGRSAVGETGLALLPFLGDGHGSRTGARGPKVVAPGVAWLREQLFWAEGAPEARAGEKPADLGIALRALSEDYVLSYGHLTPGDARRRADELRLLATTVEGAQDASGAFPGSDDDVRAAVWPMWGLEAAVRTGAVTVSRDVPDRFRTWYATARTSDPQIAAAGLLFTRPLKTDAVSRAAMQATVLAADDGPFNPFFALTAGSGLLLSNTDAFRAWNDGRGRSLQDALGPTGVVRRGDPVGDSALVMLALQAAYRTY